MANKSNHTVYVITKGCYSDYHICGVTMDKTRAERMKKLYTTRYDDAQIEEYILDECSNELGHYYVEFNDDQAPDIYLDEDKCFSEVHAGYTGYRTVRVYVRAFDEEHALKIAQDKYAERKAAEDGYVL